MPKILFQKRKKEQINKAMKGSYLSLFENRVVSGLFSFIYSMLIVILEEDFLKLGRVNKALLSLMPYF